jgi:hypothetical protein
MSPHPHPQLWPSLPFSEFKKIKVSERYVSLCKPSERGCREEKDISRRFSGCFQGRGRQEILFVRTAKLWMRCRSLGGRGGTHWRVLEAMSRVLQDSWGSFWLGLQSSLPDLGARVLHRDGSMPHSRDPGM